MMYDNTFFVWALAAAVITAGLSYLDEWRHQNDSATLWGGLVFLIALGYLGIEWMVVEEQRLLLDRAMGTLLGVAGIVSIRP